MPGIDYRQLRRQISMAEVLALLGFQATSRRGDQLRGPCPIPGCRSPSQRPFSVHLTRQLYHCFACGSHGNPLDLWSAARQLPLHAAALDLCRAAALVPPRLPPSLLTVSSPHPSRRVASLAPSRNRCPGPHRP
jgi:DNA primase